MMKTIAFALGAFAATGALAQDAPRICAKGDDVRKIEVVSPGEVGETCDVVYTSGGEARTPYHANNSADFCAMRAADIVSELTASGFDCTGSAAVTASADGFVVDVERRAEPAVDNAIASDSEPAPLANETVQSGAIQSASQIDAAAPSETAQTPDASAPSQPAAENAIEVAELGVLEEPEPAPRKVAQGAPAALVPAAPPQTASAPSAPVGRLVGAAPVQQASQTAAPAGQPQAAPAAEPAASAAQPAAPRSKPARRVEEIIAATLRAQQAAWNEGNLEAFMEGYWRDDNLQFMSDGVVAKGWNSAMRRYRERYSDAAGMGRLSLDKIDVNLVTDDVATVTGRFAVAQGAATSTGVFSLVMRRVNGVWRIVLDHTESDSAPAAAPQTP